MDAMKAQIKLQDAFSFAFNTIEKEVTEDQYNKLKSFELKKETPVVWNQFDGHINWQWKFISIKQI